MIRHCLTKVHHFVQLKPFNTKLFIVFREKTTKKQHQNLHTVSTADNNGTAMKRRAKRTDNHMKNRSHNDGCASNIVNNTLHKQAQIKLQSTIAINQKHTLPQHVAPWRRSDRQYNGRRWHQREKHRRRTARDVATRPPRPLFSSTRPAGAQTTLKSHLNVLNGDRLRVEKES